MKKHEFCIPETNTIAKPIAEIIGSTDGGTGKYLYEDTGIKCPSSISTTLKADVSADRWSNVANKPILDPFTKPLSSFLQPTTNSSTYYASNYPMPDISIPNNVPNFNFISNSNSFSSDSKKVSARYEALQKGFTGQVLGGASHDGRHKRDYSEKPQVNNEVLSAVREIDRKDNAKAVNFILFHDCQLQDDDLYWLSATFNYHGPRGLAVNTLDLSNNCLTLVRDSNLGYVDVPFFSFNSPYNAPRNILRLDLSNNNIGDAGAKIVADGLANGVFPITKQVNLSGNKITKEGHKSLMAALDSPKVKSIMVGLVQNVVDVNNTIDKAVKSTLDFLSKALQYTIEEHNKGLKGTKWDGSSVRSDSMDKWKNCKEVGQNIQKGVIGGLIKCLPLSEVPPAMFACVAQQASMELLDPDTFWCVAEVHKFVDEKEVIGDCNIF